MDKVTKRKIKLLLSSKTDERKEFEQNHHCFIGVWSGYRNNIDCWLRVTNDNHVVSWDILKSRYTPLMVRARMQLGYMFAVWLPNQLSETLERPEDVDSIQDLIIDNSFKI
jgi:hypothetical protein